MANLPRTADPVRPPSWRPRWLLVPPGAAPEVRLILGVRAMRAFGDGFVSLLLPFHLIAIGLSPFQVGAITTAALLGSGLMTLAIGLLAHRLAHRTLLAAAAVLMAASGLGLVLLDGFWPLVIVAFLGTINPTGWEVSIFLPLEQTRLTAAVGDRHRTAVFARYGVLGGTMGALGSLAAGLPETAASTGLAIETAVRGMFLLYALFGALAFLVYRRVAVAPVAMSHAPTPLGPSRRRVYALAAVFSLDAFGGGFAVQSLLALWLHQRYGLAPSVAGGIFFWTNLTGSLFQLVAVRLAARIGLINTMVGTHLVSNLLLIAVPLVPTLVAAVTLLILRSALSQMDVPSRASYVMAVVTPAERPAAASITIVPRSLAAAIAPLFAGYLLGVSTFGWQLVIGGACKVVYDGLLLAFFRRVRPPEEPAPGGPS